MITKIVYNNNTTNFSVSVVGDGKIGLQWYKNDAPIAGVSATSATYVTPVITFADDASTYYCMASSVYGVTARSTGVQIVVNEPQLTIISEPSPITTYTNTPALFTLSAVGDGSLTYQWRRSDTGLILGANNTRYNIPSVKLTDNNVDFSCIVKSSLGASVTSIPAKLSATRADLAFYTQPADCEIFEDETAFFEASAVGSGNIFYKWIRFDSGVLPGQTGTTYTIPNTQFIDNSANFVCIASSSLGLKLVSNVVTLIVKKKIISFVIQPTDTFAYVGQTATFNVSAVGSSVGDVVIYQWKRSDLGTIVGANSPTYVLQNPSLSDNTINFFCVASGAAGSLIVGNYFSNFAKLSVTNPKLTFDIQPLSITSLPDTTISFYATAGGSGTIVYQWKRSDSGTITDATSTRYNLFLKVSDNNVNFFCIASSSFGLTLTSNAARLSAKTPQLQFNVQPLIGSLVLPGVTKSFFVSATGDGGIGYEWRRSDSGTITNATSSRYNTTLSLSDNAVNLFCIASSTYGYTVTSNNVVLSSKTPELTFSVQPLSTAKPLTLDANYIVLATGDGTISYQWYRSDLGKIQNENTTGLTVINIALSDIDVNFFCVASSTYGVTVTSNNALLSSRDPQISFTTQPISSVQVITLSTNYIVLATGDGGISYQWYRSDIGKITNATNRSYDLLNIALSDNSVNFFCVASSTLGPTATSNTARLSARTPSLSIVSQPVSASQFATQTANYSISAVGDGTLSYQWYRSDIGIITGASFRTYNLVNVLLSDFDTNFFCVASTTFGLTLTSNNALLSAKPVQLTFVTQPVSTSRFASLSTNYSVSAVGDGTLSYQWYRTDYGKITGASNRSYDLLNIKLSDNNVNFFCVASSSFIKSITSNNALLSVISPKLTIVTQPSSVKIDRLNNATFSISAIGDGTITYEWRRYPNKSIVSTSRTYSIISAGLSDNNSRFYGVANSNLGLTLTSNVVTLSVVDPNMTPAQAAADANFTGVGNGSMGENGVLYFDGQPADANQIAAHAAAGVANLTGIGDGSTGLDGKYYTNGALSTPAQAAAQEAMFTGLGNGDMGQDGVWYTNGSVSTPTQAAAQSNFTGVGNGTIGVNGTWYTNGIQSTPTEAASQSSYTGKGNGTIGESDTYYTNGVQSTPSQAAFQDNFTGLGDGVIGILGVWYTSGSKSNDLITAYQSQFTGQGDGDVGINGVWYTNGIPSSPEQVAAQTNVTGFVPSFEPFNDPIDGGTYYNGNNDVVNRDPENVLGTDDFYVEMWVYPTAKVAPYPLLFRNTQTITGLLAMYLGHASYSNDPYIFVSVATHTISFGSNKKLSYNAWTHIALSRSGDDFSLYINGELDNVYNKVGADLTTPVDYGIWYVGGDPLNSPGQIVYYGYISNFKIIKGYPITDVQFGVPPEAITPIENSSLLIGAD